jgi:hypothetical protein
VVENAMNPSPSDFAHWAVGKNRGVFNWNISLIIESIRDPTAQHLRRKLAFIHRDMEGMFIVISAHADGAQFFNERFPIPEPCGHNKSPFMLVLMLLIAIERCRA